MEQSISSQTTRDKLKHMNEQLSQIISKILNQSDNFENNDLEEKVEIILKQLDTEIRSIILLPHDEQLMFKDYNAEIAKNIEIILKFLSNKQKQLIKQMEEVNKLKKANNAYTKNIS